jgi:C1A family cysteine protease
MIKAILFALATVSSVYLLVAAVGNGKHSLKRVDENVGYLGLFSQFKKEYQKHYSSLEEEKYRLGVFIENSIMIEKHNKSNSSYTMGMNNFGDMTWTELKNYYLTEMGPNDAPVCDGETPSESQNKPNLFLSSAKKTKTTKTQDNGTDNLKSTEDTYSRFASDEQKVDWWAAGKVTPVKNQKQCGSCYAFSAIASIESMYAIKHNQQVLLSEQQIVDCSRDYLNHGCGGGLISKSFHYAMEHSLESESDYPYTGTHQECAEKAEKAVTKLTGCTKIETNMQGLLAAIRNQPVSVALDAEMSLFFYKFGVYHGAYCGKQVNHAVLAVGFDLNHYIPYILIKNSWGKWWGREGYVYMKIGTDPDGVCNVAGSGHNFVPKLD